MTTEGAEKAVTNPPGKVVETAQRGRSTIEFSYFDLSAAIELGQAIKQIGGTAADWKQIAVKLGMAPDGGGFRARVMSGKTFGLLDYSRGTVALTELGMRIVDPQYERAARVEAFLAVPLHKSLFEQLNGQTLPPPPAIERMAEQLGVAPKQKDRARLAFMRSAKQAGLFELATDRLSLPPGLHTPAKEYIAPAARQDPPVGGKGGGGDDGSAATHPFIIGLLRKLPTPDTEWTLKERAKWLETASNIFDLMYSGGDAGTISVTYEAATPAQGSTA